MELDGSPFSEKSGIFLRAPGRCSRQPGGGWGGPIDRAPALRRPVGPRRTQQIGQRTEGLHNYNMVLDGRSNGSLNSFHPKGHQSGWWTRRRA